MHSFNLLNQIIIPQKKRRRTFVTFDSHFIIQSIYLLLFISCLSVLANLYPVWNNHKMVLCITICPVSLCVPQCDSPPSWMWSASIWFYVCMQKQNVYIYIYKTVYFNWFWSPCPWVPELKESTEQTSTVRWTVNVTTTHRLSENHMWLDPCWQILCIEIIMKSCRWQCLNTECLNPHPHFS